MLLGLGDKQDKPLVGMHLLWKDQTHAVSTVEVHCVVQTRRIRTRSISSEGTSSQLGR
jgi:hypothetical protein